MIEKIKKKGVIYFFYLLNPKKNSRIWILPLVYKEFFFASML